MVFTTIVQCVVCGLLVLLAFFYGKRVGRRQLADTVRSRISSTTRLHGQRDALVLDNLLLSSQIRELDRVVDGTVGPAHYDRYARHIIKRREQNQEAFRLVFGEDK